ncbi:hypothetical protein PMIN07_000821 [Paraphaeosphaeria minitans]
MYSSNTPVANSANNSASPTKRDPSLITPSAIPLPPSPPQDSDTPKCGHPTPVTPAIPIPKPKASSPAVWLQNKTNTNTAAPAKTGFSVPVGRPPSRNRRRLTINTPLPNPFLDARLSESPEKNKLLSSKMTTPADSPTTPNSRMMFKMDEEEK